MSDRFTQVVSTYGPRLMAEFALPVVGSCGFWGSFGRETGGFTHYQEIGSRANTGGRSWAQWTGPRRVAFLNYCRTHSLDPASDAAGFGFLCAELHGPYAHVVAALKHCQSLETAVSVVERLYEGARIQAIGERVAWGRKAVAILSPGHPASVTPVRRAARSGAPAVPKKTRIRRDRHRP